MDQALELHHAAVRALLKTHLGYESCVEGDSFTAAFHTPADAARFALHLQSVMMVRARAWG